MLTFSMLAAVGAKADFPFAEWWYYAGSAVAFSLAGLICGYFIWRKGNLQTHDAEGEVRRTHDELARLSADLELEKAELDSPSRKRG